MTLKRLLAVLMAFGLVAAACGGDDDDDTASPTTEGTDTTAAEGGEGGGDGTEAEGEGGAVDPADIETGAGITDDTIRVGLMADLSGIFAPLVVEIVAAHEAYFEMVNENGGIAGRQVELVILDAGYDVPRHIELYQEMRQDGPEGVALISLSVGSPHTAAVAADMDQDDMIAIPLTWYSGWSDPEFGDVIAEMYTTYCLESMNAIAYMQDRIQEETGEDVRLAIISFPGEFGQDGAAGAKLAAEALGIEIVYDGEAQVVVGADQTPIISELVNSDPNLVFATINPTALSELFGGARAGGLDAYWTGNSPTFSYQLLGTDLGPDLSQYYKHSTYAANWGADVPGMAALQAEMAARKPEVPTSDNYIVGWTYAMAAHQILEHAAEMGDMTREGIRAAMDDPELVADFEGLAPNRGWGGDDPNEYLVRESYIYDLDHTQYNPVPVSDEGGSTGLVMAEGPFVSDIVEQYQWEGPCFEPQA